MSWFLTSEPWRLGCKFPNLFNYIYIVVVINFLKLFNTLQYMYLCSTCNYIQITTVFVDTGLWKTKHPWKLFQNFRQCCVLLTDRIEIHQLQPLVWPSNLVYIMLSGCDWCISIRSVNNTQHWRKLWKRFPGCFVFQSRVSTKTVVILLYMIN